MARRGRQVDGGSRGVADEANGTGGSAESGPGSAEGASGGIGDFEGGTSGNPVGTGEAENSAAATGTAEAGASAGTAEATSTSGSLGLDPAAFSTEKPKRKYTRRARAADAEPAPVGLKASEVKPKVQGFHYMAAMFTGSPLFVLSDDEIDALTVSIVECSKHYNMTILTGKHAALLQLVATAGMIYGGKIMALRRAAMEAQAERPSPATPEMTTAFNGAGGLDLTRDTMTGQPI